MSRQRIDERKEYRVPFNVFGNKYIDGEPYLIRIEDISRGGVRVTSYHEPKASGRTVGLQFRLPGSTRLIACVGRVVHSEGRSQGIAFTNIDIKHLYQISKFVAKRGPTKIAPVQRELDSCTWLSAA